MRRAMRKTHILCPAHGNYLVRNFPYKDINLDLAKAVARLAMNSERRVWTRTRPTILLVTLLILVSACTAEVTSMNTTELNGFAARYTAAWCSRSAESVAAFFA